MCGPGKLTVIECPPLGCGWAVMVASRAVTNGDAWALLGSAVRFMLDELVRDRIIAETRGNPLALLELPRGLTATQLAGGFGLLGAQALTGRIEESYIQRLEALPEDARFLLLVAATEPIGDSLVLWRAAERLGIGSAAADRTDIATTARRPQQEPSGPSRRHFVSAGDRR
jgi:hypothetical protein